MARSPRSRRSGSPRTSRSKWLHSCHARCSPVPFRGRMPAHGRGTKKELLYDVESSCGSPFFCKEYHSWTKHWIPSVSCSRAQASPSRFSVSRSRFPCRWGSLSRSDGSLIFGRSAASSKSTSGSCAVRRSCCSCSSSTLLCRWSASCSPTSRRHCSPSSSTTLPTSPRSSVRAYRQCRAVSSRQHASSA